MIGVFVPGPSRGSEAPGRGRGHRGGRVRRPTGASSHPQQLSYGLQASPTPSPYSFHLYSFLTFLMSLGGRGPRPTIPRARRRYGPAVRQQDQRAAGGRRRWQSGRRHGTR